MVYATEDDVIEACGFNNRDILVDFMNKTNTEISDFINRKIDRKSVV
jgi:hypothetical protein